MTPVPMFIHN